jgi:hypothetical protein
MRRSLLALSCAAVALSLSLAASAGEVAASGGSASGHDGSVYDDAVDTCQEPNFRGITFNQDDVKHLTGHMTFQDCCAWCKNTTGCHAYTHNSNNCYLKSCPNQPRQDPNAVSSTVGPPNPECGPPVPPPPPPTPKSCKEITKQGQCAQANCVWSGGHCEAPPPPPPPMPPSKRTWMDATEPAAVRAQKLLQVMSVDEKLQ